MLTGDNSILQKVVEAKDSTRGGDVQETVNLAIAENEMANYTGGTVKTRTEVINDLYNNGKLTDDEVEELNETDVIKIGNISVDFSGLGAISSSMTLGEIYTDDMIGQKLTYTANASSGYTGDWIVFGKDDKGNILITTE